MIEETNTTVDPNNTWRLETPGHDGWKRSARPGDPNRYLMISTDCHCNEPSGLWAERMDEKYRKRLPHIRFRSAVPPWPRRSAERQTSLLQKPPATNASAGMLD